MHNFWEKVFYLILLFSAIFCVRDYVHVPFELYVLVIPHVQLTSVCFMGYPLFMFCALTAVNSASNSEINRHIYVVGKITLPAPLLPSSACLTPSAPPSG